MAIVSLSGLIGSGKDTLAGFLVADHGFVRVSFSDALKDVVAALMGWERELLEGRTEESRAWRNTVDPWWSTRLGYEITPRQALTGVGTDALRRHFHPDIWAIRMQKTLEQASGLDMVVSDTRFLNELHLLKSEGAYLVGIHRKIPTWVAQFYENMEWELRGQDLNLTYSADREEISKIVQHVLDTCNFGVHISECEHLVWTAYSMVVANTKSLKNLREVAARIAEASRK